MSNRPPLVARAYKLLQLEMYRYLDISELHAAKLNDWEDDDVDVARELIPDLIFVLRRMLATHEPTGEGTCRGCTQSWPCELISVAHALLSDPDLVPRQLMLAFD